MRINSLFRILIVFLLILPLSGICQVSGDIIIKTTNPQGWILKTQSSAYQIIVTKEGVVKPVFYGPVEQAEFEQKNARWYEGIEEVPVRGGLPFKTPMLEVIFSDQVRDADLVFTNADIITVEGRPTLKITQKDRFYPLEVISFTRVLAEFDILEKWTVVKNTGKKGNIKIENLQSASIVLPVDQYILTHLAGKQKHELQLQETSLTPGLKTIQNKAFKANFNPPWFLVRPQSADASTGPAYFGSLHYSGNWVLNFDRSYDGNLQILGGINFWDTAWNLKPGTTFETPKFSVGFTQNGSEGAAQSLSAYVRKTILPATHRNDLRPILYNSWFATTYNVNEQQQLELAKIAKEIGVETFVLDDGWFKNRTDVNSGLGDWEPDKKEFPSGLPSFIKKINDMGMQFGIWVEPENITVNSDLYRAHPNWAINFPNRKGDANRKILNLAREDVYQYLLKSLSKLLKENNISFVKWDQNKYLSEPGWPEAPAEQQREMRIRHVANLYRLVDELKKQFPKVWFESCASGSGRIDLGIMSRMDQAWASDNSNAIDRIFIHYGYLSLLPANTMVSWVIHEDPHQPTSLEYKFDVSMNGVMGIGYDITKWSEAEKEIAKRKIAEYKTIRPLVQQGTVYRLVSPMTSNRSALQYVSEDASSAVLMSYNLGAYMGGSQLYVRNTPNIIKLQGLKNDWQYKVQKLGDTQNQTTIYKGDFLMNVGMSWPVYGANKSQIVLITAVN